jgi:MoaA/NifB/PqqE/SkfB family radical SAM enzyme
MMGLYSFVLDHDGAVYPCFVGDNVAFGNLVTDPFESVWFGAQADKARQRLRAHHCPSCPAGCYPLPVNALELVEMVWLHGLKPRLARKQQPFLHRIE